MRCFDPRQAGHLDIEHNHIRLVLFYQAAGIAAITGFGDYLDAAGIFKELADARAHHGMVVRQDHADRGGVGM